MNSLTNYSSYDNENEDAGTDVLMLQQAPLAVNYAHAHCLCMQPMLIVMRRMYITTLRRVDEKKTAADRLEESRRERDPESASVSAVRSSTRGTFDALRLESPEFQSKADLN